MNGRLNKLIGLRVGDGIVVGVRSVGAGVVEFDVLDDGVVTQHRVTEGRTR